MNVHMQPGLSLICLFEVPPEVGEDLRALLFQPLHVPPVHLEDHLLAGVPHQVYQPVLSVLIADRSAKRNTSTTFFLFFGRCLFNTCTSQGNSNQSKLPILGDKSKFFASQISHFSL